MEPDGNISKVLNLNFDPLPIPQSSRRAILIAEDDDDGRSMMQTLLGLKGYEVLAAANGLQAVEVALTKLPDLIFLDLELPLLDGLAVTRNLRHHPKFRQVPIVIVSGHNPAKYRAPALAAGCTDYLLKPIDFDQLDRILAASAPLSGLQPNGGQVKTA